MIRISQIKLDIEHTEKDLLNKAAKLLKVPVSAINKLSIYKKSIDAREKSSIKYIYAVDVLCENEKNILKRVRDKNITAVEVPTYNPLFLTKTPEKPFKRPVIAGCGPAGLFCAYILALNGLKPIIIERGKSIEDRIKDVEEFWKTGVLNPDSNIQFGEGGAGTFSDGKLNTIVKESTGRIAFILKTFAGFGADPAIVYTNKPHVGTDVLRTVITNMRNEIIRLGGSVRFEACMTDISIKNGKLESIIINEGERVDADILIAAIGHSARDTFKKLYEKGIAMSPKPFAIGVRVEHLQEHIGRAQYGEMYTKLPAADYKLTYRSEDGRAVYSFCMCPGGFVVNASSETGMTAVNGMSNHARDEKNANSAIIVSVNPEDYLNTEQDIPAALSGIEFQRKWERAAYECGRGKVPVQTFEDFKQGIVSKSFGKVQPNIKGEYTFADLNLCLPEFVSRDIKEGITAFEHKIKGFSDGDAVLSGVETRTSSPVRIERNENFEAEVEGFYPCGEGAGYAGGITSAALDGIKTAEAVIRRFK